MKEEINPYEERMKTFFDFNDDDNDENIGQFYVLDAADGDVTENLDR